MNLANKISKFNRSRKYNYFLRTIKPCIDDKKDIISICKEAGATNCSIKRNWFFGFVMDFSIIIRK